MIEGCKFDFEDFRMIKKKTNTKINDVALAIISGGMRKYLDEHNEHPETSLVASVPMNMRTRQGDTGDANQVGAIFTSLNSTIDDPLERLIEIHKSTDDAKEFAENAPLKDALKLAGAMSPRVTKSLINTYVDNKLTRHLPMKINTVISNVPGPNFPLYCSGAKLIQYNGLGVLTPGVGLFHLVFSYCGEITITMLADRIMLPDPCFYRECLEKSFAELKAAVENATDDEIAQLSNVLMTTEQQIEDVVKKAEEIVSMADDAVADVVKPARKRAARKSSSSSSSAKASSTAKEVGEKKTATKAKATSKKTSSSSVDKADATDAKPVRKRTAKKASSSSNVSGGN